MSQRSLTESSYYDNWKTSPPEPKTAGECLGCGGEIYEGDEVYENEDGLVHDDTDCILQYAKEALNLQYGYAGVDKFYGGY
jgi:hypothetical protein